MPAWADAGTGTIEGRITDRHGAPAESHVNVEAVNGGWSATVYTWDLGDGRYRVENVPVGDYRISIYDNPHGFQWVPGKESRDAATVFTVGGGQTLTVDERQLPGGSVRATVVDDQTGAPVPRPCIYITSVPQHRQACGANGVVLLDDLPPGTWFYVLSGGPDYFPQEADPSREIAVIRGVETAVSDQLRRGPGLVTTAVDAQTGAPLADICVALVDPAAGGPRVNPSAYCTDETGVLRIGPLAETGEVRLYAFESAAGTLPEYGDQWVTANGGTGDQREALVVDVQANQTITLPTVRMDRAGTVTGIVTSEVTGQPVAGVCVYPYALDPDNGLGLGGRHCSNSTGRYTLPDLGPYEWPLEFVSTTRAWQWSGGVADRFAATPVAVTSGGTVTADAAIPDGGVLTTIVTSGGEPLAFGFVEAHNTVTGDRAASREYVYDGVSAIGGLHTQHVYLHYWGDGFDCWYGTPGGAATPVAVTAGGTAAVALDAANTCGVRP